MAGEADVVGECTAIGIDHRLGDERAVEGNALVVARAIGGQRAAGAVRLALRIGDVAEETRGLVEVEVDRAAHRLAVGGNDQEPVVVAATVLAAIGAALLQQGVGVDQGAGVLVGHAARAQLRPPQLAVGVEGVQAVGPVGRGAVADDDVGVARIVEVAVAFGDHITIGRTGALVQRMAVGRPRAVLPAHLAVLLVPEPVQGEVAAVVGEVLAEQHVGRVAAHVAAGGVAEAHVRLQALEILLQDEVGHAVDRVGAVQGRGATGDHFHPLDHAGRQHAQVHARGAGNGGHLAAAVDQGQGALHAHPAQVQRVDARIANLVLVAGLVGLADGEGRQLVEQVHDLGLAGGGDPLGTDRGHRRRTIEADLAADARTGDHHRVQFLGVGSFGFTLAGGRLLLRRGGGGLLCKCRRYAGLGGEQRDGDGQGQCSRAAMRRGRDRVCCVHVMPLERGSGLRCCVVARFPVGCRPVLCVRLCLLDAADTARMQVCRLAFHVAPHASSRLADRHRTCRSRTSSCWPPRQV